METTPADSCSIYKILYSGAKKIRCFVLNKFSNLIIVYYMEKKKYQVNRKNFSADYIMAAM
jgi:hypothetical protein